MKEKKALKPGSVPSIFPFLHRKPERELSYKRAQIREKIAKNEVKNGWLSTADRLLVF
jgi:methionine aminopeptidase